MEQYFIDFFIKHNITIIHNDGEQLIFGHVAVPLGFIVFVLFCLGHQELAARKWEVSALLEFMWLGLKCVILKKTMYMQPNFVMICT